ncbi:unnamed protein product [Clonostachys rosea f. rosea IK726]|uniref:Uncharacterized protein n=1 Tax=Clonostachys rosea f. rosea IK726 TaxID=1349383 RepID=A0ACA9TZH7_BIOOC|nr:unnamed protein product [Clonostachys rosea f. rosea IK726]
MSKTFDTCTSSIRDDPTLHPGYPPDVIIRLETSRARLAAVAALQHLAHAQLSDLVPRVLHVGSATTTDARQVEYTVSTYCTGKVPLEGVWNMLDKTHQLELVDSVVHAMEKLQTLSINNMGHLQLLSNSIGGPRFGYFRDVKHFLDGITQASNHTSTTCKLLDIEGGVALESIYDDTDRVELSHADLQDLRHHTVLCHNDLEPRNILVKTISSPEGKGKHYQVASLIDWEMSGFYPFTYKFSLNDTVLGSSNLSFSWYALFKERISFLLPRGECHTKFIRALRVIDGSSKRAIMRNVGVLFQTKWIKREQIETQDLRQGWARKHGTKAPESFTEDDRECLEQEVLSELGYC